MGLGMLRFVRDPSLRRIKKINQDERRLEMTAKRIEKKEKVVEPKKSEAPKASAGEIKLPKVTAYICTKNRYDTTLPLALVAVANQTRKPDEIIIFDDGDHRDLREHPVYLSLFKMMDERRIPWTVLFGEGKGQVLLHQYMLTSCPNPILWRVDDDNLPTPIVLDRLYTKLMSDAKIGAVAGSTLVPGEKVPHDFTSGKIADIFDKPPVQWSVFKGEMEVEHLNNSFLFRREAGAHGYPDFLSPVGHREETIFTYGMAKAGWKLVVLGEVITWHLRQPQGGIRFYKDQSMWDHDEQKFKEWLGMAGKKAPSEDKTFVAVLDNGLGDHYEFKKILPAIKKKYPKKKIVLATCYPEVFNDQKGIQQISIAEAKAIFGDIEKFNIYRFMAEKNWKKSVSDAFSKMYLG
jgi:hypothetical protein